GTEVDAIRGLRDGAVAGGEGAAQRLHRDFSGVRRGRDEDRGAADGGGRDGLDPAHARGTPWSWSATHPDRGAICPGTVAPCFASRLRDDLTQTVVSLQTSNFGRAIRSGTQRSSMGGGPL